MPTQTTTTTITRQSVINKNFSQAITMKGCYLFIVYGADRDKQFVAEYTQQQKQNLQNSQNLAQQNINSSKYNIGDIAKRLGMATYTAPIIQNFLSQNIPNSLLSRLNSGLYDIMADGKISVAEVADDFIRTGTNILDGTAVDLGYPTVSALYNAIRPDGTGIFSKDASGTATTFIKSLSKNANTQNEAVKTKENNWLSEPANVFCFPLVTKDSESWKTDTPQRKTESGLYLVPLLGNNNVEKDFTVQVVTNDQGKDMYDIKNQLFALRDSREAFDVYVLDDDVDYFYVLENCVFTQISISTEGKNSLNMDLSLMQIPEYEVTMDENLTPKTKNSSGSNKNKNGKSGKGKSNKNNKTKTTSKKRKVTPLYTFSKESQANWANNQLEACRTDLDDLKKAGATTKERLKNLNDYEKRKKDLTKKIQKEYPNLKWNESRTDALIKNRGVYFKVK